MANMLNVIDVAREIRFDMIDRPDPPKNYIETMDRLIEIVRLAQEFGDKHGITDSPIMKLLQPFEDRYAAEVSGGG
jgi:hypothetical protein